MTSKLKFAGSFTLLLSAACATVAATDVDLTAWTRVGEGQWHVAGGSADSGSAEESSYLVSTDRYGDLRISLEFLIEDDTNSGVFIRCTDPKTIDPNACYEINIWDNHPNQDNRTGSIVTLAKPTAHVDTVGKWTLLEIEAIGDLIVAKVGGVETARLTNKRASSGYVALQYGGGGTLSFRKVRVEPL